MEIAAYITLGLLSVCALAPFALLIIASFTDERVAVRDGFTFAPAKWSMAAFEFIAKDWSVLGRAYGVTLFVAVVGTTVSLLLTSMLAYALSRDGLPGRRILSFIVIFTMLFNGGIVSTYFVYSNILHIKDTIWAQIVPYLLMTAFNVILVKNYFTNNIPTAMIESAHLDGASELQIFTRIVLPVSLPILATVGLLTFIGYWNDWTNGLYFLTGGAGAKYYSIQNVLNQIQQNITFLANNSSNTTAGINVSQLPSTTIRMAMALVAILPILVLYPFFSKFFVKGITLGSVKE